MKIIWAAMLGLTATAWTFEGDWSSWDKPHGVEDLKDDEASSYGTPGGKTGKVGIYELRTLGRSESRRMGTLDGQSPSLADLNGNSSFAWTRLVGRAEAYHIDGSSRTAPYLASGRAPISEPLTGKDLDCNLVEANRDKGRDEARETDVRPGGSGEPPTTWEMDEDADIKAAAKSADNPDC